MTRVEHPSIGCQPLPLLSYDLNPTTFAQCCAPCDFLI